MLELCARYQVRGVDAAMKDIQKLIVGEDGSPANPPARAIASQPSNNSRSLTARHHLLPGNSPSTECRTPRSACQRINDTAARPNGRWRRLAPRYVSAKSASAPTDRHAPGQPAPPPSLQQSPRGSSSVGRLLHVLDEQHRWLAGQHVGRSCQRSGGSRLSRGGDPSAVAALTIRSIEHQREHRPEHHVVSKLGHQR